MDTTATTVPHDHAVNFYDRDGDLLAAVVDYAASALRLGERLVVIATGPHRLALDAALVDLGVDPHRARATGWYVALDAAETLETFMVDGSPDAGRFTASVGGVVAAAGADGSTVRAFGEMVALLWDSGNVTAAIELEALWNDLGQHHEFSLLCGYPVAALDQAHLTDISRVCDLHSAVVAPLSYESPPPLTREQAGGERSVVFVPVPGAVPAVRRFVVDLLEAWGESDLVADAALVTSELATNAVRHGDSAFRASVSRGPGLVRIAIEDVGPGRPVRRVATPHDSGGRGVAIVETLAHRSGCDGAAGGKTVWAELRATSGTTGYRGFS